MVSIGGGKGQFHIAGTILESWRATLPPVIYRLVLSVHSVGGGRMFPKYHDPCAEGPGMYDDKDEKEGSRCPVYS